MRIAQIAPLTEAVPPGTERYRAMLRNRGQLFGWVKRAGIPNRRDGVHPR
jgi:hypothetical protein